MLSKALNDPKKWGWLLETDEYEYDYEEKKNDAQQNVKNLIGVKIVPKPEGYVSTDELLNIMGRSKQKQAYRSSLFQMDDLYMYQPKASDVILDGNKPKKKKKKT